MTNNHCPESISFSISDEMIDKIKKFGAEIADRVSEFTEDCSFDCLHDMPEEWADCLRCERNVLNAQESALSAIENLLLAAVRDNGTFNN